MVSETLQWHGSLEFRLLPTQLNSNSKVNLRFTEKCFDLNTCRLCGNLRIPWSLFVCLFTCLCLVFPCSPVCLGTCSIDHAVIELRDLLASTSWVLIKGVCPHPAPVLSEFKFISLTLFLSLGLLRTGASSTCQLINGRLLSLSQIAWLILYWKLKGKENSNRKGIDRFLTSLCDCCQRRGCVDSGWVTTGESSRERRELEGHLPFRTLEFPWRENCL